MDALTDQGALAIERVHLVEDIDRVKRTAETDRLRSALLTSISHDLKTPLAAILGSAGALRDLSKSLDDAAKADLIATIIDESERLNRFIANLLDMTKLELGAVVPNADLHDVGEIVATALQRASKILAKHRVEVEISSDLPMVMVDAVLFEQVLFNLLDNAAKYAPPGTTVSIQSWRDEDSVRLQVLDEGAGIPARRSRAHLRQVLSRPEGRSGASGHGAGLGHLARLRRGPARHHQRGQPRRPVGCSVHDHPAHPGSGCNSRRRPHEHGPRQGSWWSTMNRQSASCCAWA